MKLDTSNISHVFVGIVGKENPDFFAEIQSTKCYYVVRTYTSMSRPGYFRTRSFGKAVDFAVRWVNENARTTNP